MGTSLSVALEIHLEKSLEVAFPSARFNYCYYTVRSPVNKPWKRHFVVGE